MKRSTTAKLAGLAIVLTLGSAGVGAGSVAARYDDPVAAALRSTTRSTPWTLLDRVPLEFETFHPQGFAVAGDMVFMSSVEIIERPQLYPEPIDGYDRSPGKGVGHLFVLDRQGTLLHDIVLGEGDVYHPGGIDTDGRSVWVPVGEYRPNSRSIVYRVDIDTLTVEEVFRVADHIGGVAIEDGARRIHGVSWGSRTYYTWTKHGHERARQPNPSHFIDYQDCAYLSSRMMACSGIASVAAAGGSSFELGGLALVDLRDLSIVHEVPVQQFSTANHVVTRNPVHLEAGDGTLTMWAAPDDSSEGVGTEILIYEAPAP